MNASAVAEPARAPAAPSPLPVLYVDACLGLGGASICLAEVLPLLTGVRPVIQHALPESLANLFGAWPAMHVPPWDPESYTPEQPGDGRGRQGPIRTAVRLGRTVRRALLPAVRRTEALARAHQVRLIHANNNIVSNLPAILAARKLGIPCIVHQRLYEPPSRMVRVLSRLATCHVAMSHSIADQLVEWGVPRPKVRVLYDGIDLGTMCAPRPPGPEVVVGVVGRFVHWKGMHIAVDAARRLVADCPNVRVWFIGGPSPEEPAYFEAQRAAVAASPHADRIEFLGERRDVATTLMREMDVFLHTSVTPEPFGRVVIEAMAAGCAVIATNHGGPVEICAGGAGDLVPPDDAEALAAAARALVDDPALRRERQERGQARLRKMFDIRETARQMEALYADCLGAA